MTGRPLGSLANLRHVDPTIVECMRRDVLGETDEMLNCQLAFATTHGGRCEAVRPFAHRSLPALRKELVERRCIVIGLRSKDAATKGGSVALDTLAGYPAVSRSSAHITQ